MIACYVFALARLLYMRVPDSLLCWLTFDVEVDEDRRLFWSLVFDSYVVESESVLLLFKYKLTVHLLRIY
jgi:hypothetical protein